MKKIFLTSIIISLLLLNACATNKSTSKKATSQTDVRAPQQTTPQAPTQSVINTETTDFLPDSSHVKALGRTLFFDDQLILGYSSTGAEFNINAKRLDITITGDSNAKMTVDNGSAARIAVFVNGERKLDEMILSPTQSFTVFDDAQPTVGLVRILKISEASSSIAAISKITTDKQGTISPTAASPLKIEFIGDSITCGYGVDDPDRNHHFKTSTEDNTKTYAYKTAQNLNADYSMVSVSGWGIISGYSGNGAKQAGSQLPKYYDRLAVSWTNINGVDPKAVRWDFSSFVPNIVVINLGTNDATYTKGDNTKIEEYKEAYIEFIKDIRSKNPGATIICSLGMMGQDLCNAVEAVVKSYSELTGDTKITYLKFANQSMSDGIAADWHPSEKTHEKAASLLTSKIKSIIGN